MILKIFREYVYVAEDPKDQLLLGPAYAVPKVYLNFQKSILLAFGQGRFITQ